ncbi:MAG: MAPEG family protein, partial [Gammaproteobacteria bacterium]
YLTYTILLTAVLWVPYILNQISVRGLIPAMGYQADPKPLADWAQRLKAAHYNAVENLVLFAPLVLIVEIMDIGSLATSMSAMVFFIARVVHVLSYTLKIPYVRTGAFAVGFFSLLCIVWQILTAEPIMLV